MTQEKEDKIVVKVFYIIYLGFLLWFVIFKLNVGYDNIISQIEIVKENRQFGYWNYNLVPLKAYIGWYQQGIYGTLIKNLMGNIVAFMPMGFLQGCIYSDKPLWKILLKCFFTIFIIEIVQFVTCLGSFDIDDLTMNTLGCLLGYLCLKLFIFIYNKLETY